MGQSSRQPSTWCGRSEQIQLNQVGCEARKASADAELFFLDFPFYRTNRELRDVHFKVEPGEILPRVSSCPDISWKARMSMKSTWQELKRHRNQLLFAFVLDIPSLKILNQNDVGVELIHLR